MVPDDVRRARIESSGVGWTYDEIMQGVREGYFFLFECDTATAVGEFIISPRHKVLHIFATGGDMAGFRSLVPMARQFAISNGCGSVGGTGRKGWIRAMRSLGFVAAAPAVEMEL